MWPLESYVWRWYIENVLSFIKVNNFEHLQEIITVPSTANKLSHVLTGTEYHFEFKEEEMTSSLKSIEIFGKFWEDFS